MAEQTVQKTERGAPAERHERRLAIRPASNICEEDGAVVLRLEMPGVNKDGIDVNIEGDTLTVTGTRDERESGSYLIRERRHGDYRATYTLDERVDRNKVEAGMERGVLTLTLHLKDEVKPRKITIKGS
jgi:HSP20 family protein